MFLNNTDIWGKRHSRKSRPISIWDLGHDAGCKINREDERILTISIDFYIFFETERYVFNFYSEELHSFIFPFHPQSNNTAWPFVLCLFFWQVPQDSRGRGRFPAWTITSSVWRSFVFWRKAGCYWRAEHTMVRKSVWERSRAKVQRCGLVPELLLAEHKDLHSPQSILSASRDLDLSGVIP